ncbi:MAG: hypothetical protein L3J97_04730 [Thermoplasmata archaeon]|nr:hypothetical protein [Thermoplasmata archaeon]
MSEGPGGAARRAPHEPPEARTLPTVERTRSHDRLRILLPVLLGLLVVFGLVPFAAAPAPHSAHAPAAPWTHASGGGSTGSVTRALAGPSASVHPADPTARCYPITKTTCIRLANPNTPDIIPFGANRTASYEPNATDNIVLYLMSEIPLVWPSAPLNGPHSPISLNVTGILWNGDPYFAYSDGSVWHANSAASPYYTNVSSLTGVNKTYKYVYSIQFVNRSTSGTPNFYAGETVYWQIYIVTYFASSATYSGNESVKFEYRVAGAWPFSPWTGAVQYGGPNASQGDLTTHWSPLKPNWDDTVNVSIAVTADSVTNRTAIGWALLFIEEFHNGILIANATEIPFAIATIGISGLHGNDTSNQTIPNRFTQVAGDSITYWVEARDTAPNQNDSVFLPPVSFVVNGNGSFHDHIFDNDIQVTSNPSTVIANQSGATPPVVKPGENVTITVTSRSESTSLLAAEILYTFSYPPLAEKVTVALPMDRLNSTTFRGTIPGMPLAAMVNFTIEVFDFTHALDLSTVLAYSVPTFDQYFVSVPQNDTFFFVYIYNNATSAYLNSVIVQIRGPTPAVNSISSSRFGIAYPNGTGNDFAPILIGANTTYNISVTSLAIVGPNGDHTVSVLLYAPHLPSDHRTLAHGGNYIVVQEGNSIFFWINGTIGSTIFSPSGGGGTNVLEVAAVLGLAGSGVMAFILWSWFGKIQARRKEEEKRVTL